MEAKHLDFINVKFGVSDFRILREYLKDEAEIDIENYSFAFLRRRISHVLHELRLRSTTELVKRLKEYPSERSSFLQMLEVPITEFFREPGFWRKLREILLQKSQSIADVHLWIPNTASGEELYSVLILIHEMQLQKKIRVLASNLNSIGIIKAKEGIISLSDLEQSQRNFFSVFNEDRFGSYLTPQKELKPELLEAVQFEKYDYTKDRTKAGLDIILFRNVFLYYNSFLSNQMLEHFYAALKKNGVLAIGSKERIEVSYSKKYFKVFDEKESIYLKS